MLSNDKILFHMHFGAIHITPLTSLYNIKWSVSPRWSSFQYFPMRKDPDREAVRTEMVVEDNIIEIDFFLILELCSLMSPT